MFISCMIDYIKLRLTLAISNVKKPVYELDFSDIIISETLS